MVKTYKQDFRSPPPQSAQSPLDAGDHPKLDTLDFLDAQGISLYQSMIGAMQWAVSLGQINITTAVMTMSSFCMAPHQGHLE